MVLFPKNYSLYKPLQESTSKPKDSLPKESITEDLINKSTEKNKAKAYPIAEAKLTVKILDLIQQAMNYKQVNLIIILKNVEKTEILK